MPTSTTHPDVPIFLRKTFHMIDSCDKKIACWSEDGESFIVKNPVKFESTIIPQFFKHSKFTSFVRQLNFYAFRKIKYSDSLRIDPELEKLTANFWRFRHENFRRGRPDLLVDIKRSNVQKATTTPRTVGGGAAAAKSLEVADKNTKSEVQVLKKRIEDMSKNIDHLTSMVEKVTLKQDQQETQQPTVLFENVPVGSKRAKFDSDEIRHDEQISSDDIRPDEMVSDMNIDEIVMPDLPVSASPIKRETSDNTNASDIAFVDDLFHAFNEEDENGVAIDLPAAETSNHPDPLLMQRLSDALATLPQNMQNVIVDRLISAIMQVDTIEAAPAGAVIEEPAAKVPATPEHTVQLPLAAATLAALLHHYGAQQKTPKNVQKSIPVIPVHA